MGVFVCEPHEMASSWQHCICDSTGEPPAAPFFALQDPTVFSFWQLMRISISKISTPVPIFPKARQSRKAIHVNVSDHSPAEK